MKTANYIISILLSALMFICSLSMVFLTIKTKPLNFDTVFTTFLLFICINMFTILIYSSRNDN